MAYIEREKFAERIKHSPAFKNLGFEGEFLQGVVLDLLSNAPTADVVEVKHGRWLDDIQKITSPAGIEFNAIVGFKCSLCGRHEATKEPYCNCGAKIDAERKEGD